jgi:hypothetical protein
MTMNLQKRELEAKQIQLNLKDIGVSVSVQTPGTGNSVAAGEPNWPQAFPFIRYNIQEELSGPTQHMANQSFTLWKSIYDLII